MSDRDASPPPSVHARRAGKHAAGSREEETKAGAGYRPRDSTVDGNSPVNPVAVSPSMQPSPDDMDIVQPKPPQTNNSTDVGRRHSSAVGRRHKHRSSGAFLLSDHHSHDSPRIPRAHSVRRSRNATGSFRESSSNHTLETADTSGLYISDEQRPATEEASTWSGGPSEPISGTTTAERHASAGGSTSGGRTGSGAAPLDMDSTQIVNMALNLSETRRLSSRRNVSQHLSPRLAQLPDNTVGGGLRQHLQQQRRISGRASPKPGSLTRAGTAQKLNSPLQAAFDSVHDGGYRYHFSKSSLSRAQKAKDYLELLAQHRRLLELVPPLKSNQLRQSSSRPNTPNGSVQGASSAPPDVEGPLGREYNPLQYIRNRKVRARERQAIDSEAQGFNNVLQVTEWVDEAAKPADSGSGRLLWNGLPPFHTADQATVEASPPSNASRPTLAAAKPKRPRVDWVIDPADMIADLYWLEQGDHKILVEDRHWRRVFPQDPELYRPLSRQADDSAPVTSSSRPVTELPSAITQPDSTISEPQTSKREHEHVRSRARERAHQKLQALRGLHHRRHSSSLHSHDLLRYRRGSLSDASTTDDDQKQRSRSGTIGSSRTSILEKQMLEMIAREQREDELNAQRDALAVQQPVPSDAMTPEAETRVPPTGSSRAPSHKREGSIIEASDTERTYRNLKQRPASPHRPGRGSLEVPQFGRRHSFGYDSSVPNSPDLRPTRSNHFVPTIGMDLTPLPSRPSSPSRKPFSKVKRIFRDRSRERDADSPGDPSRDSSDVVLPTHEVASHERQSMEGPRKTSSRRPSRSPIRKIRSRGTDTNHKSHRSIGGTRHHGDESSPGIRGFLKGPRIDSVLRSGVSKVGEFIWKKESDGEAPWSSDESELEPTRGRTQEHAHSSRSPSQIRNGVSVNKNGRTYLPIMPSFTPASETPASDSRLALGEQELLVSATPSSRPPSRRSARFDRLKPSRIDVQTTSTKSTPPGPIIRFPHDPDASDAESHKSSYAEGVRGADARLNAALSLPSHRQFSTSTPASRCWPIPERPASRAATPCSRAEIARLRAFVLSSGIMAMEIDRRAKARRPLGASWSMVASFVPDASARADMLSLPTAQTEAYPLAARVLGSSMQGAGEEWRGAAESFAAEGSPALRERVDALRERVRDQSDMTRAAADEADEVSRDLVVGQRLRVKRVVDVIDKMLRRRRRRFRWLRRAGWLALEWALVGFMWYVWFVVMIARVFLGLGKGVVRGVRWLLWL